MKSNTLNLRRIIFAAAILMVIALVMYVGLNSTPAGVSGYASIAESDELNEIYASVIENNSKMLENIAEYGDKYCSGYVSVKNDVNVHRAVLEEIQTLSDAICSGAETDYEKVRRIAYWVAENIYYNETAAETSVTAETISLETVLDTKTATCAGYSNMFSSLCNAQGLYCINMRGGTHKVADTDEYLIGTPMSHEWNGITIDNKWIFVDTTWISNNYYSEEGFVKWKEFNDEYFGMSLESMSYEHRIDLADYRDFKSSVRVFD